MTRDEIFAVIKANMQEIIDDLGDQEILETRSMRYYGADSLQCAEVLARSLKQLRLKVRRTELLYVTDDDLKKVLDVLESAAGRAASAQQGPA